MVIMTSTPKCIVSQEQVVRYERDENINVYKIILNLSDIHKDEMKVPLSVRGYSPKRTLESIHTSYTNYETAGCPKKDAQYYDNCNSQPIWNIPLAQVYAQKYT